MNNRPQELGFRRERETEQRRRGRRREVEEVSTGGARVREEKPFMGSRRYKKMGSFIVTWWEKQVGPM
ncbi:hypothetical protein BHE74_00025924 [Ensete ventricosum]|nr:hypothetical protein BHE74_00025924 [Ensete ventricosum]